MDLTDGWTFEAIVQEGAPVDLAGANPWSADWVSVTVGNITVEHPSYPGQLHNLSVYKLAGQNPSIFFAAGELSNGAWAFYLPTNPTREFLARHRG
ncbi:hypothetical protein [Kribbella ginsengisoli]|uniref:Uncharacterized protein n=1 Tax=Kribbella ginsengisoli TaxID=363865 RepID=A0ABP6VRC6_9ACTN